MPSEEPKNNPSEQPVSLKSSLADPKNIASLIVLAVLLAFGVWRIDKLNTQAKPVTNTPATQSQLEKPMPASAVVPTVADVSYEGVAGKTALELLKGIKSVKTKEFSGIGEYVDSIDGVAGDSGHFWSFYLNGKQASEGAGTYITKSGDQIVWKYEALK